MEMDGDGVFDAATDVEDDADSSPRYEGSCYEAECERKEWCLRCKMYFCDKHMCGCIAPPSLPLVAKGSSELVSSKLGSSSAMPIEIDDATARRTKGTLCFQLTCPCGWKHTFGAKGCDWRQLINHRKGVNKCNKGLERDVQTVDDDFHKKIFKHTSNTDEKRAVGSTYFWEHISTLKGGKVVG